jgi:hypothetical protein
MRHQQGAAPMEDYNNPDCYLQLIQVINSTIRTSWPLSFDDPDDAWKLRNHLLKALSEYERKMEG